jgi:aldose 1-epimerase
MHNLYRLSTFTIATLCAALLSGCKAPSSGNMRTASQISSEPFGRTPDGVPVSLFTLRNSHGAEVKIMNYGGILQSFRAPDRHGQMGDVVLGYDNLDGYIKESPYFGALVGRYGNRIAKGKFTLNGKEYTLATNNGPNSLHGGKKGFDKVIWEPKVLATPDGPALQLRYLSKDGEEGFPGNLSVTATYTFTDENALRLDYEATTDKDTIVNLTQHSYFNLALKGDVLEHVVMIDADKFTPVDSTLIPTGELRPVQGTPFDFRKPTPIGARINDDNEQLKLGGGYDHNWVLNKKPGELKLAARVQEPTSGRVLEVITTEPGLQFYTGNFLNGKIAGKGGVVYHKRNAFCMEPEHFPDSPNHPEFPPVVLKPGETYRNTIIYKLSVSK